LKNTLVFGLRATMFVMLPASVAFIVLSKPIVSALFMGGKFDAYSAHATASALLCYSIGLCAYGSTKILQSCFFALKDTLTPTKIAALSLVLNIVFNALLMFPLKIAGIALATSFSGIISFFALLVLLQKRLAPLALGALWGSSLKIAAASLGMGAVCWYVQKFSWCAGNSMVVRVMNLVLVMACGVISYILFCLVLRVKEIHDLRALLFKRLFHGP
jgi:putative peptidoglycan lipid II flippase